MIGAIVKNLRRDRRGIATVEMAMVTPVLLTMLLGVYDIGRAVARQHELQTAITEAETIALATAVGATSSTTAVRDILRASVNLPSSAIQVSLTYRCNAKPELVAAKTTCKSDEIVTSYMNVTMEDTYVPTWTKFGVGGPIPLRVDRTVIVQ